jgi:hypothetical protein
MQDKLENSNFARVKYKGGALSQNVIIMEVALCAYDSGSRYNLIIRQYVNY